jgi:dTDP-4-dehydrorhamnose reductase
MIKEGSGMRILVTGGQGQLGRAFQSLAAASVHEIITVDKAQMDITRQADVFSTVTQMAPDIIIHCAAYTNVDHAEQECDIAYKVNVIGTQNIAAACLQQTIKLVYVSTDYVFDGVKQQPYTEFDATNPINVYGKTKLAGEKLAAAICPRLFIARTAWLYGDGPNFVRTILKLAGEREFLTVVNDQTGTPTYAVDLAQAILTLVATEAYGIYHMTNSGSCTWYEFAREILLLAGLEKEVRPLTTAEFNRPAARPQHSILRNYMLELTIGDPFRPWQQALREYLARG